MNFCKFAVSYKEGAMVRTGNAAPAAPVSVPEKKPEVKESQPAPPQSQLQHQQPQKVEGEEKKCCCLVF